MAILATLLLVQLRPAQAVPLAETIDNIGRRWDAITYHWPKARKSPGLTELLGDIRSVRNSHPRQPELLVWEAIVLVTRAGLNPRPSILGDLDDARELLLQSATLNPTALHGAALLTLGCLYHKAPGWPLSFGDDRQAEQYFQRALALNPMGIESHYYYGDFLRKTGRAREAFHHFRKVLDLPSDPAHPYLSARLKEKAHKKMNRLVARLP